MVFCEHCGGTVAPGFKFCENCGAPVDDKPLPSPPPLPVFQQPTAPAALTKSPAPDISKRVGMSIIGGIVFGLLGAAVAGLPGLIIGFIIGAAIAAFGLARISVD